MDQNSTCYKQLVNSFDVNKNTDYTNSQQLLFAENIEFCPFLGKIPCFPLGLLLQSKYGKKFLDSYKYIDKLFFKPMIWRRNLHHTAARQNSQFRKHTLVAIYHCVMFLTVFGD